MRKKSFDMISLTFMHINYFLRMYKILDKTNLLILMEDKKVLGEFSAKISKAKILYDNTSATCQKLRREAAQLEK